jgi:mycothiol synthase
VSAFPPPPVPDPAASDARPVEAVDASPEVVRGILALAERARAADGVGPFNEQTRLTLGADGGPSVLVVRGVDGETVAAAVVARGDAGAEAELAVDPGHRGRGVGRALLDAVLDVADGSPVSVWAHGDHPAARALAAAAGLDRARELLQLRASVTSSFTPDDADDWVALNARAFASHPEQGRMTRRDLDDRAAEPWFDPATLLLARSDDGRLAGFHWMKVEDGQAEVYVLGVDPDRAARGLGSALLAAGLDLLAERGHEEVDLYVEADNAPALALYRRAAFRDAAVDVQYRRA